MKKNNWIIIILVVVALLGGWFYWSQWRPSTIRKNCAEEIKSNAPVTLNYRYGIKHNSIDDKQYEDRIFTACMRAKGL